MVEQSYETKKKNKWKLITLLTVVVKSHRRRLIELILKDFIPGPIINSLIYLQK